MLSRDLPKEQSGLQFVVQSKLRPAVEDRRVQHAAPCNLESLICNAPPGECPLLDTDNLESRSPLSVGEPPLGHEVTKCRTPINGECPLPGQETKASRSLGHGAYAPQDSAPGIVPNYRLQFLRFDLHTIHSKCGCVSDGLWCQASAVHSLKSVKFEISAKSNSSNTDEITSSGLSAVR